MRRRLAAFVSRVWSRRLKEKLPLRHGCCPGLPAAGYPDMPVLRLSNRHVVRRRVVPGREIETAQYRHAPDGRAQTIDCRYNADASWAFTHAPASARKCGWAIFREQRWVNSGERRRANRIKQLRGRGPCPIARPLRLVARTDSFPHWGLSCPRRLPSTRRAHWTAANRDGSRPRTRYVSATISSPHDAHLEVVIQSS